MTRGFTLIELLVVMSILAILAGMLMPIIGIAQRSAQRSNAEALMRKVSYGIRSFRTDWGAFPYQAAYPALATGGESANRLYYHIGTDIDWTNGASNPAPNRSDAEQVKWDMEVAAGKYAYAMDSTTSNTESATQPSVLTYRQAYVQRTDDKREAAVLLNRMAQEQARLAVISGNLAMRGQIISSQTGVLVSDRRSTPVLVQPVSPATTSADITSGAKPGWACDYLAGEIEVRSHQGEAILDPWGHPLVYISQNLTGIKSSVTAAYNGGNWFPAWQYGLGNIGFDPTSGPADDLVAAGRHRLLYGGRIRLSASDAGDGKPTPAHTTFLPNASDLMGSDIRYYAAPGYETDFELWSAGRDGRFAYMRNDQANRDNIPAAPYTKALARE